jgi:CDP-paratose 2-epimerase
LPDVLIKEQADRVIFADGRKGITETEPLDFHSPYGCSKGAADQYVHDYARIFGLKTVVMRQSCIYGPHQFGIEDQGWVAWFLIAVMMGRKLHIYGNGKQVRDILHVADLVDLYDRIIEHIDVASGNVYNVGGGSENTLSLLEFLDLMDKKFDLHPEYDFADTRPGDQPIFVSDNSRAQSDLDWSPTYSVEDGLHNLIQWLRDNHSRLDKFYK